MEFFKRYEGFSFCFLNKKEYEICKKPIVIFSPYEADFIDVEDLIPQESMFQCESIAEGVDIVDDYLKTYNLISVFSVPSGNFHLVSKDGIVKIILPDGTYYDEAFCAEDGLWVVFDEWFNQWVELGYDYEHEIKVLSV